MKPITEIYEKYKIMPQLQEHQLRVAAVAKQICDSLTIPIDEETVVKACLLHDMGNILKFDLDYPLFPDQADNHAYWKSVQADYKKEYGPDEHQASLAIAKELGLNDLGLKCIESIDFTKTIETAKSGEIELKICDNADLRVDPHGVVSLRQRLEEGSKRYKNRPDKWVSGKIYTKLVNACVEIEGQIFKHAKIKPPDITNKSIAPIIEELRTYEI
jgi:hypothetical protein